MKQHKETAKTIVIAVLVSGIVAFIAGVRYQTNVQAQVNAAKSPTPSEVKN